MSEGMTKRPTTPGLAPALPPVRATGAAAACALVAEAESSQLAPSCAPSNPSAPGPIHPSLPALTRLLAREIGRSEIGNA